MQSTNLNAANIALDLTKHYFEHVDINDLLEKSEGKSELDLYNEVFKSMFINTAKSIDDYYENNSHNGIQGF